MPACAPLERDGVSVDAEDVVASVDDVVAAEVVVAALAVEEGVDEVDDEVVRVAVSPMVTASVEALSVPQQAVLFLPQHQVSEYVVFSQGVCFPQQVSHYCSSFHLIPFLAFP